MSVPFAAVAPGTDLGRHARALTRVHDAVLSGSAPPERPRRLVARSWQRVLQMGLNPDSPNGRVAPQTAELVRRRASSPIAGVIDDLRGVLSNVSDAAHFVMVVTDAEGVILWREGETRVRMTADRLGFTEGAAWTERHVGTNAIGTALAEATPVELFAAEHFEHSQHAWYCTAAPMHDPRTGELLGIVDVSGPALTFHPAVGALAASAVRLAETSLWRAHQARLERLRRTSEHLVAAAGGPLLIVDEHGWTAHHAGIAARDRIEVPRAGHPLVVPGMGLCLPERIRDGWLVRPAGDRVTISATLTGQDLVVTSDVAPWRTVLTPRHAQLVRLLAGAGAEGLSAAQLSVAVFGDGAHVVATRAEVSRLRRVVGALVATNPYRLAEGVSVTLAGQ